MSGGYRRDVRWLAARDAYADPAWDLDPDLAFTRRIIAARDMYEIERQHLAAPPVNVRLTEEAA